MKISVIIPVYNAENFIAGCLESLAKQTLQEIEIICVNDGSSDNSLNILETFARKDERIKIITQKNQGVSAARNAGINLARGEFIGFVDADDRVNPDFYEKLYNSAVKYSADIVCGDIERVDGEKIIPFFRIKKEEVFQKTKDKYRICKLPCCSYIWNKIYRRTALLKLNYPFSADYHTYEDMPWTHVVLDRLGALVTVPNAVYYYYNNKYSASHRYDEKQESDLRSANAECINYVQKLGIKVDYKCYPPKKRIRYNILGFKLLDIKIWPKMTIFYCCSIPVLKIRINNNY